MPAKKTPKPGTSADWLSKTAEAVNDKPKRKTTKTRTAKKKTKAKPAPMKAAPTKDVVFSIRMPRSMRDRFKIFAIKRGETMESLVQSAIMDILKGEK